MGAPVHWVQLGNDHAREAYRDEDGVLRHRPVDGRQATAVMLPDGWGLQEMLATVLAVADEHFDSDPDTDDKHPPAWVESSDEDLQVLVASHFGLGRTNLRPAGWTGDHPSVTALREREG
jgi:hypothetical protein